MVKIDMTNLSALGLHSAQVNEQEMLYSMIDEPGYGKLRRRLVAFGIHVFHHDFQSDRWFSGNYDFGDYLEISYGIEGIYEVEFANHRCQSLGEGDILLIRSKNGFFRSSFPLKIYRGVSIFIDLPQLFESFPDSINKQHFSQLLKQLQCHDDLMIMHNQLDLQCLFESLYLAEDEWLTLVIQILNQLTLTELLPCLLGHGYCPRSVILKLRAIKELLIQDLAQHYTIDELAQRYRLTPTMLKSSFKSLYGDPPYTYVKKRRMHYAAKLIKEHTFTIGEIGGMLGYQNASKFASAFKSVMGISPREYREKFDYLEHHRLYGVEEETKSMV